MIFTVMPASRVEIAARRLSPKPEGAKRGQASKRGRKKNGTKPVAARPL